MKFIKIIYIKIKKKNGRKNHFQILNYDRQIGQRMSKKVGKHGTIFRFHG